MVCRVSRVLEPRSIGREGGCIGDFGESETVSTPEPFTHHEDLLWFLKALKIDRLSLVGLSNYAIALPFTIAYP
jgi:hypothetical protein